MNVQIAEISRLSVSEKIQLVEDIWDSIATKPDELPISEGDKIELSRRLENYEQKKTGGTSWLEFKQKLSKSR